MLWGKPRPGILKWATWCLTSKPNSCFMMYRTCFVFTAQELKQNIATGCDFMNQPIMNCFLFFPCSSVHCVYGEVNSKACYAVMSCYSVFEQYYESFDLLYTNLYCHENELQIVHTLFIYSFIYHFNKNVMSNIKSTRHRTKGELLQWFSIQSPNSHVEFYWFWLGYLFFRKSADSEQCASVNMKKSTMCLNRYKYRYE